MQIYNCSKERKGYSGTAILTKFEPLDVYVDLPDHPLEGRIITASFPSFYLVCVYTPNAGSELKRLDYRINQWDSDFRRYMLKLKETKPVVVVGDLNVAHTEQDIYDPYRKEKMAGYTPQERSSFGELLESVDFVDTWRNLNPTAK